MRVLVVEDEALISFLIEEALREAGCTVVGPAARIARALKLAEAEELDCAILDINVHGQKIYPVAAVLERRGIPYLFITGYGRDDIRESFRDRPVLRKPFEISAIETALAALRTAPHRN